MGTSNANVPDHHGSCGGNAPEAQDARRRNRLGDASSPYLRRHADQAIAWHPWGEDAFGRASREGKPVLVSIGYLACYWCHVMAEESFSDPRVTQAIDAEFIAIKVDREEHPAVDRAVLDGLAHLGARTGWPVTAFLTPEGAVFAGGSYYPPEPRHGLPGFVDVLSQVADQYRRRDALEQAAPRARATRPAPSQSAVVDVESYATFLGNRLLETIDPLYGGFGQNAPRFAQPAVHELLWRRYVATGTLAFGDAVAQSLARICGSALHDPVGGGFHRYCADAFWTVPHFEKMLYDNAQLAELLVWVWRGTHDPSLRTAIEDTLDWAVRDLLVAGVGFASSLSAHGAESLSDIDESGLFYRWAHDELDAVLGPDTGFFGTVFTLEPFGDHPRGTLHRTERALVEDADRARLAACLDRLRAHRDMRPKPARDDKVLADWNGLMLVALLEAGSALDRRDWLRTARQTFETLVQHLDQGAGLHHCITDGALGPPALLEDYAALSRAALRLFEAFGTQGALDRAERWVAVLDAEFWDSADGGYFMSSHRSWSTQGRVKTITETSLPSGNGLMIGVLARLHEITGRSHYRARAEALVAVFRADIVRHGIAATTAINNVSTLARFVRIAVSGHPSRTATRRLLGAALACSLPDRMVLGPGSGAGADPDDTAQAQVCIGTTCLLPFQSAEHLRALLLPGGFLHAEAASTTP